MIQIMIKGTSLEPTAIEKELTTMLHVMMTSIYGN